jgi:hypothetical protein
MVATIATTCVIRVERLREDEEENQREHIVEKDDDARSHGKAQVDPYQCKVGFHMAIRAASFPSLR